MTQVRERVNTVYMFQLTPEARERGTQNSILFHKIPKWFDCPAEEFINYWLVGMENGTIPRPTKAELSKLNRGYKEEKPVPVVKPPRPLPPPRIVPDVPIARKPKLERPGPAPKVSDDSIVDWLEQNGSSSTGYIARKLDMDREILSRRLLRLAQEGRVSRTNTGVNRLANKDYVFWQKRV